MRRPTQRPLWRTRDFLKLWTGQSISEFGSQVSQLAIPCRRRGRRCTRQPVRVLAPRRRSSFLPFILFALPAGVWVDRLRAPSRS